MYPRRDAAQAANLIEPGAHLDERISRLVAQHQPDPLRFVAPERAGYVIAGHLLDPRPGVVIATANEHITDRSRALEAIGRLGQVLRRALGEREATAALPSDETLTTSSLDAAREYVIAQNMLGAGREEEAAAHYQRALEHDSGMGRAMRDGPWSTTIWGGTTKLARTWRRRWSSCRG
jgi:hypothetical protein